MNNYPDYSSPTSSNELFPAYSRKRSSSSAYESRRQQLYDDEAFYKYNSPTRRLQFSDAYSPNQNSHSPGVVHGSINEDSKIYRHSNRARHDFQQEQDLYSSQRYPDTERGFQYPLSSDRNLRKNLLRDGHMDPKDTMHDSFSFANHSENREPYSDYSRSSFSGERNLLLDDYTGREYLNQNRKSGIETAFRGKGDFTSISKDVGSEVLAQKASLHDIPSSNNMSSLSKGEEILKEIKILQQQQKLQEILNVSLSIAKQMKHSPVLRGVDRESLSNNNSSSIPEEFSDQAVSQSRFQNYTQMDFKPDCGKDGEIANSCRQNSSFDNLWAESNSNISLNKPNEKPELPSVNEQKGLSFSNLSSKLVSGNEIAITGVTPELDKQMPIHSFDNKLLSGTLDISSTNNVVSEADSSNSEWLKSHSIPFLGETTNTPSIVDELRPSPGSQNVEQPANPASSQNQTNSDQSKEIVKSNLEDALQTLEIMDPVVGLDFIIENKSSVYVDGSFAFQCKLCNSSITRSLIIDHILGSKHRIRFVKIKDEDLYNHIMSPLVNQIDKEEAIYKAAHDMEKKYGRGRVVVQDKVPTNAGKSDPGIKISFKKIEDHTRPAAFELNNENDLEISETEDVNIKKESSTSPDDIAKTLSKVPMSNTTISCPVSSPGNNNLIISKVVSSDNSEINHNLVSAEPSIVASPLKHDAFLDRKATTEMLLSPNTNSNDNPPSLKRPATPLDNISHKHIKINENSCKTEIEPVIRDNPLCKDSELCRTSSFSSSTPLISTSIAQKYSLTMLLGHMSKWEISSSEEAEMVSKTVDVLLKLLLRYKLQQDAGDDIENVMKSFLSTYLEKSNEHSDSTKNCDLLLEKKDNVLIPKANCSTKDSASEGGLPMEAVENKDSIQTNSSPQNILNTQEAPKCLSNTETALSKSSDKPASGLQPPPFFCWSKSNTPPVSTANSSAPIPTVAMNWSSPYGSNLGYYQQQGYSGMPSMYHPYTLPMTQGASPVALPVPPVPLTPINPVSIKPPLPPPSIDRPPLPLSFGLPPPPPPPTEPPPPPSGPPALANKLLPPLPPPLPSEIQSQGAGHKVLPPLPTCVPPPPPPLN